MMGERRDTGINKLPTQDAILPAIRPSLGVRRNYIYGLDVTRAIAISLVIVSHYIHVSEALGVAGVELFFVLSGYLVGSIFYQLIIINGTKEISGIFRFLQRRWARTIPNYLLFLALWFILIPPPTGFKSILPWVIFAQNFYHSQTIDFFGVAWSLSVEEWFYFIIPGSIFIVAAVVGKPFSATIFIIMLTIAGCFLLRFLANVADANADIRTVVLYRLDALALGVASAVIADRWPTWWAKCAKLWFVGFAGLLVLSFVLMRFKYSISGLGASSIFLAFPVSSVLVLARLILIEERRDSFQKSVAECVKRISQWAYSLYLIHMLVYLKMVDTQIYIHAGLLEKLSFKVGALTITICMSAVIYRYFEKPMLRLLSPKKYRAVARHI